MEDIPLDSIEYDECEVVSSDEEPQIEISISTNVDWTIPPLNEDEMMRLRNYVPSDSDSDSDTSYDSDEWIFRDELPHLTLSRHMPYYLPLKTLDQYDEIQAIQQSNGKGYNRTFIG